MTYQKCYGLSVQNLKIIFLFVCFDCLILIHYWWQESMTVFTYVHDMYKISQPVVNSAELVIWNRMKTINEGTLSTQNISFFISFKWNEQRLEKTSLFWGFPQGLAQTGMGNHWRWLEAWKFGFRKKKGYTNCVAKTKALICCGVKLCGNTDLHLCFHICIGLVFSWRCSNTVRS